MSVLTVARMMKLASRISDIETMGKVAEHLSWSHIIALLPLKMDESLMYYVNEVAKYHLSVRDLRREIERKAYECRETRLIDEQKLVETGI